MFLDQIGLKELSQKLEAKIGGRVSPMIFLPSRPTTGLEEDALLTEEQKLSSNMLALTDPFLMNVHHRHTFSAFDPFRLLQKLVFPEGMYVDCMYVHMAQSPTPSPSLTSTHIY
jgi:hypothetical protein